MRLLVKRGYRVDVVPDGRQAVEAVKTGGYAAVLMDCHMPEMDGYEATREIRRHEGDARRTPVIAMTTGAMEADRDKCIEAGMDDYLSKPLEPVHVNAVLEYWIGVPDPEPAAQGRDAGPRRRSPTAPRACSTPVSSTTSGRHTGSARGADLIVDLVGLFLRHAPGRVEAVERAVATHDTATVFQVRARHRNEEVREVIGDDYRRGAGHRPGQELRRQGTGGGQAAEVHPPRAALDQ